MLTSDGAEVGDLMSQTSGLRGKILARISHRQDKRVSMNRGSRGNRLLRWIAGIVAGASYLLIFACNSPFIPIPPPNPTFTESATPGEWQVSTPPDSRASSAVFYIYNSNLGSGLIQRAAPDGSMFASPLIGQAGDRIGIHWERSTTDGSSTICRVLGAGTAVQGCY
jgi:hypothetical protein